MATIGSLAVNIVANTGALQRGLNKSRGLVKSFAATAAVGAAGATAAVAGIVRAFESVAPAIDAASKASARLDVPTEKLVALQYAADLSGTSADALVGSMTKMVNNVAEAAQGTGMATAALQRLGLDVQALKNLSPDEMFLELADAISKVPNVADRTAAAIDIFGRSGANLLPMLMEGRKGIETLEERGLRLGITFTAAQGRMVEAARDAMGDIGTAIEGLQKHLAIGLAPAIQVVSEGFASWVASFNPAAQGVENTANQMGGLMRASGKLLDVFADLKIAWKMTQVAFLRGIGLIQTGVHGAIKLILKAVDSIPGVDLADTRAQMDSATATLENDSAQRILEMTREIDKLLVAKKPSEQMEQIFKAANNPAKEAADAVAQAPEVPVDILPELDLAEMHRLRTQINESLLDLTPPGAIAPDRALTPTAPPERRQLGIIERGSREAFDHMRGRGDSQPEKQVAKNTKEAVNLLQQINAKIQPGGHGFQGDVNVQTTNIA